MTTLQVTQCLLGTKEPCTGTAPGVPFYLGLGHPQPPGARQGSGRSQPSKERAEALLLREVEAPTQVSLEISWVVSLWCGAQRARVEEGGGV